VRQTRLRVQSDGIGFSDSAEQPHVKEVNPRQLVDFPGSRSNRILHGTASARTRLHQAAGSWCNLPNLAGRSSRLPITQDYSERWPCGQRGRTCPAPDPMVRRYCYSYPRCQKSTRLTPEEGMWEHTSNLSRAFRLRIRPAAPELRGPRPPVGEDRAGAAAQRRLHCELPAYPSQGARMPAIAILKVCPTRRTRRAAPDDTRLVAVRH
jgi:hypothetical protein